MSSTMTDRWGRLVRYEYNADRTRASLMVTFPEGERAVGWAGLYGPDGCDWHLHDGRNSLVGADLDFALSQMLGFWNHPDWTET